MSPVDLARRLPSWVRWTLYLALVVVDILYLVWGAIDGETAAKIIATGNMLGLSVAASNVPRAGRSAAP